MVFYKNLTDSYIWHRPADDTRKKAKQYHALWRYCIRSLRKTAELY
jgi:hypothetical protein